MQDTQISFFVIDFLHEGVHVFPVFKRKKEGSLDFIIHVMMTNAQE